MLTKYQTMKTYSDGAMVEFVGPSLSRYYREDDGQNVPHVLNEVLLLTYNKILEVPNPSISAETPSMSPYHPYF